VQPRKADGVDAGTNAGVLDALFGLASLQTNVQENRVPRFDGRARVFLGGRKVFGHNSLAGCEERHASQSGHVKQDATRHDAFPLGIDRTGLQAVGRSRSGACCPFGYSGWTDLARSRRSVHDAPAR
jgi:hypothetical protein